jgi:DNA-binding NtrC family response regulator
VLVVDDDRQMVSTICDVLRLHGWDTVAAYDGESAVRATESSTFAAVLMDVRMPGINGVEAFRAMRRAQPTMPVILMTAYAAQELLAQAVDEGVLTIMPKPVQWPRLTALLQGILDSSQAVLVVDDDPGFLATLTTILTDAGRAVYQAQSVDEALTVLARRTPGVIILDLKMPGMEPTDAVMAIREVNPTTVLVLYSGHPQLLDATVGALPSDWVHASLQKPFDPNRLMEVLDALAGS